MAFSMNRRLPMRAAIAGAAFTVLLGVTTSVSAQQPSAPPATGAGQSDQQPNAGGCPHHPCGHHGAGHGPGGACGACMRGAGGPGLRGAGGMDADHAADMDVFHYLLDHGKEIRRTVTVIPKGVDTLTESDNPEVADNIRKHVVSMTARVEEERPIHRRDPLFAEIFAHAKLIDVVHEATPKGVRVIETSDDPYVAKLIQAHAEVVTLFVKNGRAEMMKNHEVPAR